MMMQPTRALLRPVPKEEHSAHTISQRLRTLKKIPPELIPLGIVLGIALGAAGYSISKKLMSDKTLRLTKSNRSDTFK
ncbi:NADH-ubiquinone reductase complex 1 MLRQ subunit [Lasallia pustulata]|uniref:NADH-ubiquinone reductase complex 1 MLRQ subunit n=2 Tax=Lasallia pustulata TaxID=136370 RepID=A0A1W5CYK4_9LECA|nr:NADH-ubiquinone reductase complex 1 MLRQ subunit [Lasallia pustulata]